MDRTEGEWRRWQLGPPESSRFLQGLWSARGQVLAPAFLASVLALGPTLQSIFQTGNMNQNNMTYSTIISAVS